MWYIIGIGGEIMEEEKIVETVPVEEETAPVETVEPVEETTPVEEPADNGDTEIKALLSEVLTEVKIGRASCRERV